MNLKAKSPKKVLFINTFGIGDVLFTTPFISNLKLNFPDAKISYLGNKRTEPLLRNYEKIDKVFVYERDEFLAVYKKSKIEFFKKMKALLREIKNEQFDIVFDFSLNTMINFFVRLTGIKNRIGFNFKNRSPFLTQKIEFDGFDGRHVVEFYLEVLEQLGLEVKNRELELTITEEDAAWADNFLKESGIKVDKQPIGVIPGAGASWGQGAKFRRWSSDKYAKLVDKIIEKYALPIILFGDRSEGELCAQIEEKVGNRIIPAYGKTSIGQFAALLARCKLVVLNDGGPLHIAVAVKTKTVAMFGPVNENVYGPFGSKRDHLTVSSDILCRPCYRRFRMTNCEHVSCLNLIEVDDVLKKVEQVL